MTRSLITVVLAGALGAMSVFGLAAADTAPDNAIKYRKAVMSVVGANMNGVVMIAKGDVEHRDALSAHARMLAEAAKLSPAAFRQNTDGKGKEKTTSKAKVWDDWADFEKGLKAFAEESAKLASLAESGDMDGLRGQIGKVGKTCKSCHDDYRDK